MFKPTSNRVCLRDTTNCSLGDSAPTACAPHSQVRTRDSDLMQMRKFLSRMCMLYEITMVSCQPKYTGTAQNSGKPHDRSIRAIGKGM